MANYILDQVKELIKKELKKNQEMPLIRQAQIDSAYVTGHPKVIFPGEDVPGEKTYPYLEHYTPVANDHVLMVLLGKTYIILGKII